MVSLVVLLVQKERIAKVYLWLATSSYVTSDSWHICLWLATSSYVTSDSWHICLRLATSSYVTSDSWHICLWLATSSHVTSNSWHICLRLATSSHVTSNSWHICLHASWFRNEVYMLIIHALRIHILYTYVWLSFFIYIYYYQRDHLDLIFLMFKLLYWYVCSIVVALLYFPWSHWMYVNVLRIILQLFFNIYWLLLVMGLNIMKLLLMLTLNKGRNYTELCYT